MGVEAIDSTMTPVKSRMGALVSIEYYNERNGRVGGFNKTRRVFSGLQIGNPVSAIVLALRIPAT